MVLESMKARLEPIHIYDPEAPALDLELWTYAEEIERLYSEWSVLLRERFIATARDVGLQVYEEIFGPERSAFSIRQRREMLRSRLSLKEGDFTPDGIKKALDSFGLEYVISEFPSMNRLNIIAQTDYSKAEQAFIKREVDKIIPAHLLYQLVFNTRTWRDWDAVNKSFSALDLDNLTWAQIDALE